MSMIPPQVYKVNNAKPNQPWVAVHVSMIFIVSCKKANKAQLNKQWVAVHERDPVSGNQSKQCQTK